jgi:hypothetical protein
MGGKSRIQGLFMSACGLVWSRKSYGPVPLCLKKVHLHYVITLSTLTCTLGINHFMFTLRTLLSSSIKSPIHDPVPGCSSITPLHGSRYGLTVCTIARSSGPDCLSTIAAIATSHVGSSLFGRSKNQILVGAATSLPTGWPQMVSSDNMNSSHTSAGM